MKSLPAVGQRVGIRTDVGAPRVQAKVLEVSHDRLTLVFEGGTGLALLLREGPVLLEWPAALGLARAQGRVTQRVGWGEPFEVELVGEHETLQRRNYVRVRMMIPVTARRPDEKDEHRGTSVDVSGGGMRIRFDELEPTLGEELQLEIWVDEEHTVPATARVVLELRKNVCALAFEEIRAIDRERVIELVFIRLRRLAAAERWECPSKML